MAIILIADDDTQIRRSLARDLGNQDHEVHTAGSVDEAIQVLAGLESLDVLVTDLRMPDRDGLDLIELIRETRTGTSTVLMSAYASGHDYQRAIELGSVEVLNKPFTRAQLIDAIDRAIDCQRSFHGSIHGLSLVELLQMFHHGRRAIGIMVGSHGAIYMDDGELIHATTGGAEGLDALADLLGRRVGHIKTSSLPPLMRRNLSGAFEKVLLEALRRRDGGADGPSAPPPSMDVSTRARHLIERLRDVHGYIAACIYDHPGGRAVGVDGGIDLSLAAVETREFVSINQMMAKQLGIDSATEIGILITASSHYHLLRCLWPGTEALLYLVLGREDTNPAMAQLELEQAMTACDSIL